MTDCRSLVLILGILKIKAMRGYRQNVHDNYSRHIFDTDSNAKDPKITFFQCTAVCKQVAARARKKGRAGAHARLFSRQRTLPVRILTDDNAGSEPRRLLCRQ